MSGQLEGELGATALGAIYTFGPTFRAENSNTPRHLAEFWMIEPEVAFIDKDELMDLEEDFIKYCVKWALDNCKDDLEFLNKMIDKTLIATLESVIKEDFRAPALYRGYRASWSRLSRTDISSNSLSPVGAWTSAVSMSAIL